MRIVYFAHYAGGSDAASVMDADLFAALRAQGHEVTVLAPFRDADAGRISGDVAAGRLPRAILAAFGYLRMILGGLRASHDPDRRIVAQYHVFHPATLAAFLTARLRGRSLIVRAHDPLPGSYRSAAQGRLFRIVFSFYRRILVHPWTWTMVPSPELQELTTRELGLPATRVLTIPNNVTEAPSPGSDANAKRREVGLEGARVVLQFGSFTPPGARTFVDALRILARAEVKGLILADPWRGTVFRHEAERAGIRDRIVVLPPQKHASIPTFLALADVCIGLLSADPTARGALPRSTMEAMAAGKPVVLCRGVASASLVDDGRNAVVIPPEDANALARAIARVLDDPSYAAAIGLAARRTIEDRFQSDTVARVFVEACEGIP